MKNNIPVIYWTFRTAWTLLHFIVVGVAMTALLTWAIADDRAIRAFEPAKDKVLDLQEQVSGIVPWPWTAGQSKGKTSSRSGQSVKSSSAMDIQVDGNVNVRSAPRLKSKVVKVLEDGSWVESDCRIEGSRVKGGPNGPTSWWVHIPDVGYASAAYVLTATNGLPKCK